MTTMDVLTSDENQLKAVFDDRARTFYEDFQAVTLLDGGNSVGLPLNPLDIPVGTTPEPFALLKHDETGESQVWLRERQVRDASAIGHKVILGFSLSESGDIETTKRYVAFAKTSGIGVIERKGELKDISVKDYALLHIVFEATSKLRQSLELAARRAQAKSAA